MRLFLVDKAGGGSVLTSVYSNSTTKPIASTQPNVDTSSSTRWKPIASSLKVLQSQDHFAKKSQRPSHLNNSRLSEVTMNIYSRVAIQNAARRAAEKRNDYCEYPYGSEHRAIWVDAYVAALDTKDCISAAMSAKLKDAVLV